MILQDQTTIWFAKRTSIPVDGEIQEVFTDLQSMTANVQVMTNAMQLKTYGEIKDAAVEIRTENPPKFRICDPVYLQRPDSNGNAEINNTMQKSYPDGDFRIDSIKPSYIGGFHIKNPTVATASVVTR